jgi:hypothetical protein
MSSLRGSGGLLFSRATWKTSQRRLPQLHATRRGNVRQRAQTICPNLASLRDCRTDVLYAATLLAMINSHDEVLAGESDGHLCVTGLAERRFRGTRQSSPSTSHIGRPEPGLRAFCTRIPTPDVESASAFTCTSPWLGYLMPRASQTA